MTVCGVKTRRGLTATRRRWTRRFSRRAAFAPSAAALAILHGGGDAERFSIRDDSTILTALRAARAALASCASDVEATARRRAGGGGGGARGDSHAARRAERRVETMGEKNVASDRVRRAPRRAPRAESGGARHTPAAVPRRPRGGGDRRRRIRIRIRIRIRKSNPRVKRRLDDVVTTSPTTGRRRRRRRFFRATFCAAKCFARRFCAQLASRSATIFTPRPFATRACSRACARASRRKPLAPPPRRWKPRRAGSETPLPVAVREIFSKGLMRRLRYGDAVARAIARVGDAFGSVNVRKFVVPALVRALGEDTHLATVASAARRAAERFERFERVSKKSSSQKDDDDREVTPRRRWRRRRAPRVRAAGRSRPCGDDKHSSRGNIPHK